MRKVGVHTYSQAVRLLSQTIGYKLAMFNEVKNHDIFFDIHLETFMHS